MSRTIRIHSKDLWRAWHQYCNETGDLSPYHDVMARDHGLQVLRIEPLDFDDDGRHSGQTHNYRVTCEKRGALFILKYVGRG